MSHLFETTEQLASIDRELAALNAHCRSLQTWLCRRLACGNYDRAALLRYFGALSLATARISTILVKRAAIQGPDEFERFLADACQRVRERALNESDSDPSGLGPPLPPTPTGGPALDV